MTTILPKGFDPEGQMYAHMDLHSEGIRQAREAGVEGLDDPDANRKLLAALDAGKITTLLAFAGEEAMQVEQDYAEAAGLIIKGMKEE